MDAVWSFVDFSTPSFYRICESLKMTLLEEKTNPQPHPMIPKWNLWCNRSEQNTSKYHFRSTPRFGSTEKLVGCRSPGHAVWLNHLWKTMLNVWSIRTWRLVIEVLTWSWKNAMSCKSFMIHRGPSIVHRQWCTLQILCHKKITYHKQLIN